MNTAFSYLLESSACLALSLLFYRLLLAKTTFFQWNRILLLLLSAGSCLLPLLSVPVSYWYAQPALSYAYPWFLSAAPSGAAVEYATAALPLQYFLWWLYLAVAAILSIRLLLQLLSVLLLAYHSPLQKKEGYWLLNSRGKLPASSFFHFVFLPHQSLTHSEYQQVLKHELVHVRQRHSLDLLFFRILCVVFWFNPFAYLLSRSMEEVHEYLADREAAAVHAPAHYARLMLKLAAGKTASNALHHLFGVKLKNRIHMLHKQTSDTMEKLKFILVLPLLGVMLLLFSFEQPSTEDQLEKQLSGTWTGSMLEFEQSAGPPFSQAMIEGGRSLHVGSSFVLHQDKTYEIMDPSGVTNGKGTWHVQGKLLLTKDAGGEEMAYEVLEINDHLLSVKQQVSMTIPGKEAASKGRITLTYTRQ